MNSTSNQETKYIKRGLIFGICVLLCAGNVYYDDVYNGGVSTSLKSKWERLVRNKKIELEEEPALEHNQSKSLK